MNSAARKTPTAGARWRRPLSLLLLTLAALVLAAAMITFYAQRNLFNSARFADRAQSALDSPAVRDVASEQITQQLIDQIDPDLVAVRPVLDATVSAIIDTTGFKRLFRSAVLQLHRAALTDDFDGAVLVVANVGVIVSQALQKLSPDVARQIPDNLDAQLVSLGKNGGGTSDLVRIVRASRTLSFVLPVIALLLLTLAVLIAPDRRRAVSESGVAIVGAGALLAGLYAIAGTFVLTRAGANGTVERDAGAAIWDAFMNDFFYLSIGLAVVGAAIAAAAAGTLRTVEIDRRILEAARAAGRPPKTAVRRVIWAIACVALGIWMITDPVAVLKLVGFIIGTYLVFRGLNEVITLAMPSSAFSSEPGEKPQFSPRMIRLVAATIGVFFLATFVAAVIFGRGGLETLGVIKDKSACNGAQSLCAKRYNEVAYPTTHNSMSAATDPGWIFPEQDGDVAQQLNDGIRGLMLDVYYGFPGRRVYTDGDLSSPAVRDSLNEEFGTEFVAAADRIRRSISKPTNTAPELYACHGFCELGALPLAKAFGQIKKFLDDNPREVLTIVFEDYVPPGPLARALDAAGIAKYAYRGPTAEPWPTLKEMIDGDQRVLLLLENGKPAVPWMHRAYDVMQETPFAFKNLKQLESRRSCRENRGAPTNSVFLVNHWIDTAPAPRPSLAAQANRRSILQPRIERCEKIRERPANLVAVDFYKRGDLIGVVDTLNGVE